MPKVCKFSQWVPHDLHLSFGEIQFPAPSQDVGLLVNKNIKEAILETKPIDDRILKIRIAAKPKNISLIQVYAPTSEADESVLLNWYSKIEHELRNSPKNDIIILQGDWNAKIGSDLHHTYTNNIGKHCNSSTNERVTYKLLMRFRMAIF